MTHPPSPHPLDFDWRYDDATAQTLASLLQDSPPIVAIGAPTIARLLEATGVDVTLEFFDRSESEKGSSVLMKNAELPIRRSCLIGYHSSCPSVR